MRTARWPHCSQPNTSSGPWTCWLLPSRNGTMLRPSMGATRWPAYLSGWATPRQQAERHLALEAALAQSIGAVVVGALVLVLVLLQRLERPVRGGEGQVGEERPALLVGLPLLQVLDYL